MRVTSARLARLAKRAMALGVLAMTATLGFTASAGAAGSFVIGDENATVGTAVTFWGAQWWKDNALGGGAAPAAFKGFANSLQGPPECGAPWSTDPGNSSDPPAGPLPETIEVIVASHVSKSGPTISGDTAEVVLVATNTGYQGNPGHPGTGTVLGVLCRAGEEEGGGGIH